MTRTWYSPQGTEIVGTLETITGRASIQDISDTGEPDYSGGTEVFWDEQKTVLNEAGQAIFLDENGEQWTFDQLTTTVPE
jgi:hypothetical protein